jgi:hypothetical protein
MAFCTMGNSSSCQRPESVGYLHKKTVEGGHPFQENIPYYDYDYVRLIYYEHTPTLLLSEGWLLYWIFS